MEKIGIKNMEHLTNIAEAQRLFRIGRQYEELGDIYHAVKVYKKAGRTNPNWGRPFFRLSLIYKERKEWKPTFHYSKKAVECDEGNKEAWWNLSLAATVLQHWKTRQEAWTKLGHTRQAIKMLPIELTARNFREVVWARQIDLVRARIESIPHPFSGRRYGEVILHECKSAGNMVMGTKTIPIYKEVQRLERSFFDTYSVLLHTDKSSDIDLLDKLCLDADLGFDNWSNTNELHLNKQRSATPEYYMKNFFEGAAPEQNYHVIGIASKKDADVLEVMEAWRVISLNAYSQLERH